MDVAQVRILDLFCRQQQFVFGRMQRLNRWREQHWSELWKDIESLSETDSDTGCLFLGNIILAQANCGGSDIRQLHVIDGQHRLIAIVALLAAMRDIEIERKSDLKAEELQRTYLCHPFRSGLDAHKFLLAGEPLASLPIISLGERAGTPDWVLRAYDFFYDQISQKQADVERLVWGALSKINVVTIADEYRSATKMFLAVSSSGCPTSGAHVKRLLQA